MCCGNKTRPNRVQPVQQSASETPQERVETAPTPVVQNVFLDNINSQRAATALKNNYHKQRFWNGG